MRMTLLMAAMLAAAPAWGAGWQLGRVAELPVTMRGMQPMVPVELNGQNLLFMADSGAAYSLITPGMAQQLKLKLRPPAAGFHLVGIGGQAAVMIATADKVVFGGLDLSKIYFFVGGSEIGHGSAGVLGQNVLGYADAEYDLGAGVIRLMQAHGCEKQSLAYWVAGKPVPVQTIPIQVVGQYNKHVTGTILVNGVKMRATFDTGASTSMLTRAAAARAGVRPGDPNVHDDGYGSGIGSRVARMWIAPFASVKIGDEEIKDTRIRFEDVPDADFDMLLGADFFLAHHVYVSNAQHRLYVTYNGGPVFRIEGKPAPVPVAAGPDDAPADAEGYSRRGAARAARRDYEAAIVDFDKAVALAPAEPRYLAERAGARLAARQPLRAKADLDAALKLDPGNVEALLTRARMYLADRDEAAARTDLEAAAKAAAPEADARLTIAGMLDAAHAPAEAIASYGLWIAAHKVDSKRPQALNGRCWARARAGKELAEALDDCNAALRLAPKEASFLDSRGLVRLRMGDNVRAIADYDAALKAQPRQAWSLYGRGLAKLRSGDTAGGHTDIAAALAIAPRIGEDARRYGIVPAGGDPR